MCDRHIIGFCLKEIIEDENFEKIVGNLQQKLLSLFSYLSVFSNESETEENTTEDMDSDNHLTEDGGDVMVVFEDESVLIPILDKKLKQDGNKPY